jgi:hypothetical protein
MGTLITFAKRVRNFITFATFLVLAGVLLFIQSFSEGSFDPFLRNFDKLSPGQFFWLILIFFSFIFFILILLIVLSYWESIIKQYQNSNQEKEHSIDRDLEKYAMNPQTQASRKRDIQMQNDIHNKFPDQKSLRRWIIRNYSLDEFETLCRDLQNKMESMGNHEIITLDNVRGTQGYEHQVRAMLDWLGRRNLLGELIRLIREQRGEVI